MLSGRLSAVGLLSLFCAIVVFGVIMLLRHGRRLGHDISHLLPRSFRGPPVFALVVVGFVVAPLAVGLGLVLTNLLWIVILWPYLSWSERGSGALLAALLVLTPTLNSHVRRSLNYASSAEDTFYQCTHGRCGDVLRSRVDEMDGHPSHRGLAMSIRGVQGKRRAAANPQNPVLLYEAENYLKEALAERPNDYVVQVNGANVEYMRKLRQCRRTRRDPNFEKVAERYRNALKGKPKGVEALYNLGVVTTQMGNIARGAGMLDEAGELDAARVSAQRTLAGRLVSVKCPQEFNGNKQLMDALPEAGVLADQLSERMKAGGQVLLPFGYLLAGIVDVSFIAILGILSAVLLLLGAACVPLLRPSHHCTQCGQPGCGRCRRELHSLVLCSQCLYIRIQGSFVDSREKWLRDRRMEEGQSKRRRWTRAISLVLPGLSHLVRGRAVVGVIYLLLFLFLGLTAVVGPLLLPGAGVDGAAAAIGVAALVLAALVYILAAIDALVTG